MLKHYMYNGREYQFEEKERPEGAVEIKKEKTVKPEQTKEQKPANKAGTVKTK